MVTTTLFLSHGKLLLSLLVHTSYVNSRRHESPSVKQQLVCVPTNDVWRRQLVNSTKAGSGNYQFSRVHFGECTHTHTHSHWTRLTLRRGAKQGADDDGELGDRLCYAWASFIHGYLVRALVNRRNTNFRQTTNAPAVKPKRRDRTLLWFVVIAERTKRARPPARLLPSSRGVF